MEIRLSSHFTYGKLARFTLPSVAMMIFTSVYGVVDGYFVSNFAGKTAFASVNLIMPVLMILSTSGFMLGTGGTALVAKTLGEGDKKEANSLFSLFVYTAAILGTILSFLGFIFIRPLAALLGASEELLDKSVLYARIILLTLPFMSLQVIFQSFFVAAEKPKLGFFVTLISGVTNMILDAVLCILLPEEYKLTGAAVATAVSQFLGGLFPLIYFAKKNDSLLRLGKTRFNGKAILKGCTNGSSEFMTNISMSVVSMLFNIQLLKYAGENGISAYGVMMYVSMIFTAAFVGYSIGISPVISYNFGAKNQTEMKNLLRKSLYICIIAGAIMALSAETLAVPLANLFVGYDNTLKELTVSGFRIFSVTFVFIGFGIFASGFFTALNDGLTSAIISFVRTLVLESAAVLLLPLIFGIDGIWFSTVIAELLAFALGISFLVQKRKRFGY